MFLKKIFHLNKYKKQMKIRKIIYACKNLLNLDCKDIIRFDTSQVA